VTAVLFRCRTLAPDASVRSDKHRVTQLTNYLNTLNNSVFAYFWRKQLYRYTSSCLRVQLFTCVGALLNPMLFLNLGGVIRQRVQYLVQVTGSLIQPFDCVPEFVGGDFTR
jgi:hypothetical protein